MTKQYGALEGLLVGPWHGQASSLLGALSSYPASYRLPAASRTQVTPHGCPPRLPAGGTCCSACPLRAWPSSRSTGSSTAQLQLWLCCSLSWTLLADPDPHEMTTPSLRERSKPAQASPHPSQDRSPVGHAMAAAGGGGETWDWDTNPEPKQLSPYLAIPQLAVNQYSPSSFHLDPFQVTPSSLLPCVYPATQVYSESLK